MKLYLWPLGLRCLDCKTIIVITELLAAQDGEFCIKGYCSKCKTDDDGKYQFYTFRTDWNRIKKFCKECDDTAAESERNKPLRPPLALPSGLSEEDLSFLKDFHIIDELGGP